MKQPKPQINQIWRERDSKNDRAIIAITAKGIWWGEYTEPFPERYFTDGFECRLIDRELPDQAKCTHAWRYILDNPDSELRYECIICGIETHNPETINPAETDTKVSTPIALSERELWLMEAVYNDSDFHHKFDLLIGAYTETDALDDAPPSDTTELDAVKAEVKQLRVKVQNQKAEIERLGYMSDSWRDKCAQHRGRTTRIKAELEQAYGRMERLWQYAKCNQVSSSEWQLWFNEDGKAVRGVR